MCRAHIKMHSRRQQLLILAENRALVRSALFLQRLCCLSAAMDAAGLPPLQSAWLDLPQPTVCVYVCVLKKAVN